MLSTDQILAMLTERRTKAADLAGMLGLMPASADRILAGTRHLRLEEARKLVEIFGAEQVTPVALLSLEVARLLASHAAETLGVTADQDDARIETLARDFQAMAAFRADPSFGGSAEEGAKFLRGLRPATTITKADELPAA
jgi:hypothetical protein